MGWLKTHASAVKWGLTALFVLLALAWLRFTEPTSPWSPRRIIGAVMPEPRETVRIERVEVPGPERIRVITKEKIIEKFKDLPTSATMQDNGAQVVAIAAIPESPAGGTAIAVLRTDKDNVATGSIEYQPKPIPFFQVKKEFGVRAGMGTGGLILGEIYARPARIGPVTVEVRGYGKRDDRSGADFGGVVLGDYRF